MQIWFCSNSQISYYHHFTGIQLSASENRKYLTRHKFNILFLFQVVSVRAWRRTGSRTWWRGRTWCWSVASPPAWAPAPAPSTGSGHPTTTTTMWPSERRPSAPDTREYSSTVHLASYWSLDGCSPLIGCLQIRQHLSFRDKVLQHAICVEIQAVRMNCKDP